MTINAFIGHSFTQEDDALIATILTYLTQVSDLLPAFTWTHAKSPEPVSVDQKVLALLEGKNLFIGICTRKERVISPTALSSFFLKPSTLYADESSFQWKTSDWIIQEIGLAIGRGMKIILLVEDGIRLPGALQGNLEYIPLSRNSPEKSFGILLGMLKTLIPNPVAGQSTGQPSEPTGISTADTEKNIEKEDYISPKPEWNRFDYEIGMMQSIATNNSSAMQDIQDKFSSSPLGTTDENRIEFDAFKEYTLIAFSRGGDIAKLVQACTKYPQNENVARYLARAYEKYEEFKKAAPAFKEAAYKAIKVTDKVTLLGESAICYLKADQPMEADVTMAELYKVNPNPESDIADVEILLAEKNYAAFKKEHDAEIAAQERLLELDPSDDEIRFSLAYKYSEVDLNKLAAFHYSKIPSVNRSAMAWNNLGVAYESLKLPLKSVKAYRTAMNKGETLAMSNLASKFRNAGFDQEAQEILEIGSKIEGHHRNIEQEVGLLNDAKDAEAREETAIFEKAKVVSEFYRRFGDAISCPYSGDISGIWVTPSCEVLLQVENSEIVAIGNYQSSPTGLLRAILHPEGRDTEPKNFIVEYRGKLHGCSISGFISRKEQGALTRSTTLLGIESDPTFLMWFSDSTKVLNVMERPSGGEPIYQQFTRK